jgi:putative hydrolase of the HAD superfamily
MDHSLLIREATLEDYESLAPLFAEGDALHREALPHIFRQPEGPPRARPYFASIVTSEEACILLAQVRGQVVGLVQVLLRETPAIPLLVPRRYAVIDNIVVAKDSRHSGVGRALMEQAQGWAEEQGATLIELNVWAFNQGASLFYERLGYTIASYRMWKSLTLPKALLVDLDDTILALTDLSGPCWQRVCERFAPRLEGITPQELFAAIWESCNSFWQDPDRQRRGRLDLVATRREIVTQALQQFEIDAPILAGEIADTYSLEEEKTVYPLPGAIEALQKFREQGVRLALLSNGEARSQRSKVERFGLDTLFDCIAIEGEFGTGKPDERIFRHALETLGVQPEEAWMVGDNLEGDILGAQRLGILGIWVDNAGQGLPQDSPVQPDRIVHSLAELSEFED